MRIILTDGNLSCKNRIFWSGGLLLGKKYDLLIGTRIIPVHGDEMKVSCYIRDNSDELINLTIFAGDKDNAKRISQHWAQNADDIYMKIIELMS